MPIHLDHIVPRIVQWIPLHRKACTADKRLHGPMMWAIPDFWLQFNSFKKWKYFTATNSHVHLALFFSVLFFWEEFHATVIYFCFQLVSELLGFFFFIWLTGKIPADVQACSSIDSRLVNMYTSGSWIMYCNLIHCDGGAPNVGHSGNLWCESKASDMLKNNTDVGAVGVLYCHLTA